MRRFRLMLAAVALLALVLPASAQARTLVRETDTVVSLSCDELTAGDARAFLFVQSSDSFGTFADFVYWATDGEEPDAMLDGATGTLTPTGGSVTLDLTDAEGNPVGTATATASFVPVGPPQEYEFTDREGNRIVRVEGVFQELSVTGSLEVDLSEGTDATFSLDGCFAYVDTLTVTRSDPSAFVNTDRQLSISCGWEIEDGFVELFATSDQFGSFTDLFILINDEPYGGFAEPELSSKTFSADYELISFETEESVGTASASATLSRGERISFRDEFGSSRFTARGWELAVNGTLTLDLAGAPESLPMDDASCDGSDVRVKEQTVNPAGPKLKNDAPSAALPLQIGRTIEVRTGGTALRAEEPCVDEEGNPLPIGHTAWWTFTGTGDEMTVDTAGSDFDTVLGVYVLDDGSLEQVACVDDVFDPETEEGSLQAAITIDTDAGVTYYVQAGGFGEQAGTLRLRLE